MSSSPFKTTLALIALLATCGSINKMEAAVREIATITTNQGVMEFELWNDTSPRAVSNFKYLADSKYYDGTTFHRNLPAHQETELDPTTHTPTGKLSSVPTFMIQGGDLLSRDTATEKYSGQGGPRYTIPDEPSDRADRKHVRGVLSMAKTAAANSGGSQFFIMYGDAPWLDNLHATMGRMISGESTLQALENQPLSADSYGLGGKTSVPSNRLVVQSVRIRSETTTDAPDTKPAYQNGSISGLLRNNSLDGFAINGAGLIDRLIIGSYQVAISAGGAFTGQFQYYGRRATFYGRLPLLSSTQLEQESVMTVEPKSKVPLRVRLRVRQSAQSTSRLSITVCAIDSNGNDVTDATMATAAGEITPTATLATRYTASFDAPQFKGATSLAEIRGRGFMTMAITPATGACVAYGRLQDGRAFSLSRPLANEGGRITLPMHFHELTPDIEAQRALFNTVALGDWMAKIGYALRMVGSIELPPSTGALPTWPAVSSYFLWHRAGQTVGAIQKEILGFLVPNVSPWTPPSQTSVMAPFAAATSSALAFEGSSTGQFQVARPNLSGVFSLNPAGVILRFNPLDGTFQGSFLDASTLAVPRRAFQGVLLQGINGAKGSGGGFVLTNSASIPVTITVP